MKKFIASFISLGVTAAATTAAIADNNASCPSCLSSRPIAGVGQLMSAVPSLHSNLAQLGLAPSLQAPQAKDNVAPILAPRPQAPAPGERSYLNIVPNDQAPKEVPLPGSDVLNGLNPSFVSPYWNWNAPSYSQWLPQIYSSPVVFPEGAGPVPFNAAPPAGPVRIAPPRSLGPGIWI